MNRYPASCYFIFATKDTICLADDRQLIKKGTVTKLFLIWNFVLILINFFQFKKMIALRKEMSVLKIVSELK